MYLVSTIETSPTDDITACLVDEYPSKAELDEYHEQVALLDVKKADLSELLKLYNKQSEVLPNVLLTWKSAINWRQFIHSNESRLSEPCIKELRIITRVL